MNGTPPNAVTPRAGAGRAGRRALFFACLLALLVLFAEGVSHVGLRLLGHGWFDLAGIQAQRHATIVQPDEGAGIEPAMPVPGFVRSAAIHPFLGFVENPDTSPWDITDFGFYETDRPVKKRQPGSILVGVFGGSFAYQFRESGLDAVLDRLSDDPSFRGQDYVVMATALGGYKQPQQLMTLSYLLSLGAEFDVVINIDGFNEVALHEAENEPKGVFPAYPRSWYHHTVGLADREALLGIARAADVQEGAARTARIFSRFPLRHLAMSNLIWVVRDRSYRRRLAGITHRVQQQRTEGDRYVATGPAFDPADGGDLHDHLAGIWARSSLQMDRLCRANGIVYVHVLQPNQYFEGSKPLSDDERRAAFREDHPYRPGVVKGYPRLVEAGKRLVEQGVLFLDMTQAYAGHPETIYVDDCCHVSPEGNRILAPAIADRILAGSRDRVARLPRPPSAIRDRDGAERGPGSP